MNVELIPILVFIFLAIYSYYFVRKMKDKNHKYFNPKKAKGLMVGVWLFIACAIYLAIIEFFIKR